jgi:hypothetical protein
MKKQTSPIQIRPDAELAAAVDRRRRPGESRNAVAKRMLQRYHVLTDLLRAEARAEFSRAESEQIMQALMESRDQLPAGLENMLWALISGRVCGNVAVRLSNGLVAQGFADALDQFRAAQSDEDRDAILDSLGGPAE